MLTIFQKPFDFNQKVWDNPKCHRANGRSAAQRRSGPGPRTGEAVRSCNSQVTSRGYTMTPETPKLSTDLDESIWLDIFEFAFQEDAGVAERAAWLWHYLLTEIESGPEGITNARQSLENAIRVTFPFTETYRACRNLFDISFEKGFNPKNSPLALLNSAIERAKPRKRL
jgi:hypothetical protein